MAALTADLGVRRTTGDRAVTAVGLLVALLPTLLADTPKAKASPLTLRCQAEAGDAAPLPTGRGGVSYPKRTRYVAPAYPKDAVGRKGSGMWVGEALIDETGAVTRVWSLRTPVFEPAWPEFSDAIVEAIRQWKYTPTVVNGVARPVCMAVTVNINWR